MALSADVNTQSLDPPNRVVTVKAGAADTLYKGALINIGTDGFAKVAADVTAEVCMGVLKEQVVAAGSNAEDCEIITGAVWVAHSGAAATDVGALFYATADDTLADSSSNVGPAGLCVGVDTSGGFVLIDFNQKNIAA